MQFSISIWIQEIYLVIYVFFKPAAPGIPRRSTIQVLTRLLRNADINLFCPSLICWPDQYELLLIPQFTDIFSIELKISWSCNKVSKWRAPDKWFVISRTTIRCIGIWLNDLLSCHRDNWNSDINEFLLGAWEDFTLYFILCVV